MPDWKQIVSQRLSGMKLAPEERSEVIAEITAHLEECYRELCDAGSPDPEGYTLAQVPDWKNLARRIRKSKEAPMSFSRKVLIPGFVALLFAQVSLWWSFPFAKVLGVPVLWQFHWPGTPTTVFPSPGAFYVSWLLTMPFWGALGAWMARRGGAGVGQRLTAALFPALYRIAVNSLSRPNSAVAVLLFWVLPAIACALGALPLLFDATRQAEPAPPTQSASA